MTELHSDVERPIAIHVVTQYIAAQSAPEQRRYVFSYSITIENRGPVTAQLLSRHWVITDSNGHVQEVRGDGVVGVQPYLRPGERFQYTSGAVIETPVGSMHGEYQLRTGDGVDFSAPIAPFRLSIPHILH